MWIKGVQLQQDTISQLLYCINVNCQRKMIPSFKQSKKKTKTTATKTTPKTLNNQTKQTTTEKPNNASRESLFICTSVSRAGILTQTLPSEEGGQVGLQLCWSCCVADVYVCLTSWKHSKKSNEHVTTLEQHSLYLFQSIASPGLELGVLADSVFQVLFPGSC